MVSFYGFSLYVQLYAQKNSCKLLRLQLFDIQ